MSNSNKDLIELDDSIFEIVETIFEDDDSQDIQESY